MTHGAERTNGIDLLARMTGLQSNDLRAIAESVRVNQARLDGCEWHCFKALTPDPRLPGYAENSMYHCENCGGVVNHSAYHWHQIGRKSARLNNAATQAPGYQCVGGPLDGQMRTEARGVTGFPVIKIQGDQHVTHQYRLRMIDRCMVWLYQEAPTP